jgi:hypothetical protein
LPLLRSQGEVLAMSIEPVADKLGKLLKLLSSPRDGEVVAAARAILRTLAGAGADIHELAERIEEAEMQRIYDAAYADGKNAAAADAGFSSVDPPSFYEMAQEIEHNADGRLSEKEQKFVADMVRWCARREPSEKQAKWLHAIYVRLGRRQ